MVTLSLIAFCLGILALGCYQMFVVAALLRVDGPAAVTLLMVTVAYALAGQAHPAVVAALKPVREFTDSRLRFLRSPGMLLMLSLVLMAAATEAFRGHEQFSVAMPILAAVMIAGTFALLYLVRCAVDVVDPVQLSPRRVHLLPPEARPIQPLLSLPTPFKPPRFALVIA